MPGPQMPEAYPITAHISCFHNNPPVNAKYNFRLFIVFYMNDIFLTITIFNAKETMLEDADSVRMMEISIINMRLCV